MRRWIVAALFCIPPVMQAAVFSVRLGVYPTPETAQQALAALESAAAPYCLIYKEDAGFGLRCMVGEEAAVTQAARTAGLEIFEIVTDDPAAAKELFLERSQALARAGKVQDARAVAAQLYAAFPDDPAVMRQYATLLFWTGETAQAVALFDALAERFPAEEEPEAAQQARTALVLEKGEALLADAPAETVALIDGQPPQIRTAYDVMLLRVQALIRTGDLPKAETEARMMAERYPDSAEAEEQLANLLLWQGKHDEAVARAEARYARTKDAQSAKALAGLYRAAGRNAEAARLLEDHEKIRTTEPEAARLYIASLLDAGEKEKANTALYALDEALLATVRREDPGLYCRTLVHSLEIGGEAAEYSDHRYADDRAYVRFETPVAGKVFVGTAEQVWRYDQTDTNFHGDLYSTLPDDMWGYLTFSVAPGADFLPRYMVGAHLYKPIGAFEVGLGYEYSSYSETDVHMIVPEYTYYFGDGFSWMQKLYWVPQTDSYALQNQLKYTQACHWNAAVSFTPASSNEKIDVGSVFRQSDADLLRVEGEYRLTPEWLLGGALYNDWYRSGGNAFTRSGMQLYLRRYW